MRSTGLQFQPAFAQAGGVKRPAGAAGMNTSDIQAAVALAAAKRRHTGFNVALKVTSQTSTHDVGVQTLLGDYAEVSTNHNRKTYKKTQKIPGFEDVEVWLYYWDNRDGPDFAGWWFGDQVGGAQVWARCASHGPTPPRVGWKIPWDAPKAEAGQLLVELLPTGGAGALAGGFHSAVKLEPGAAWAGLQAAVKPGIILASGSARAGAILASPGGGIQGMLQKVQAGEAQVAEAEAKSKAALAVANETLSVGSTATSLEETLKAMSDLQSGLTVLMKSLTADISAARAFGPSGTPAVTGFSRLTPKVRALQASISMTVNKLKNQTMQAKSQEMAAVREKEAEVKNAAAFKAALPDITEAVNTSEDMVETIVIIAQPLVEDPPEADAMTAAFDDIEASAADAQKKIGDARVQINSKLQDAKNYAPEARKAATTAFVELQTRLSETQKKLNPYKKFRTEFQNVIAAKKELAAFGDKISEVEIEVEKVSLMTKDSEKGQMLEDGVTAAEETAKAAQVALATTMRSMDTKLRTIAAGPSKVELTVVKERAQGAKVKLEAVLATLKKQREGLAVQQVITMAEEKVAKAEEAMEECGDAETPFLKGIEVLPPEESARAVEACEAAARNVQPAVRKAATFCKQKAMQVKAYGKDAQELVGDKLQKLQEKADAISEKLTAFKTSTVNRRLASVMKDALETLKSMEGKVGELKQHAEVFAADDFEKVDEAKLKAAAEAAEVIIKAATENAAEARRQISAKQKELPKNGDLEQAVSKLQARLGEANNELSKHKKAVLVGERFLKGRQALAEETARALKAEGDMDAAEKQSKAASLTDVVIKELNTTLADAVKAVKAAQTNCERHEKSTTGPLKGELVKVVDRCKKVMGRVDALKVATKEQRERVLSETYVEEATKLVTEMDASLEKVNESEMPFLKGIEVLDLKEAQAVIKDSEACATVLQSAISEARTFIAAKSIEVKKFDETSAKTAAEAFAKLSERVNSTAAKLSNFRKDNESRKKGIQMQEAADMVKLLEDEVKAFAALVEPFGVKDGGEDASKKSAEEAGGECQKLSDAEAAVQKRTSETTSFLEKAGKQSKDNKDKEEALKDLRKRTRESQSQLAQAKKVFVTYEQAFVSKKLLAEASRLFQEMDADIKSTHENCNSLVEGGGVEFLVAASVQRLADGVRKHMEEKSLTHEEVFKTWNAGKAKSALGKDAFIAYVAKLPEILANEALTFPAERQAQMFTRIAGGDKKTVGLEQFKAMFERKFTVMRNLSLTDGLAIADSKTVAKLEAGEILEALATPQMDEASKMERVQVKTASGKDGWATLTGSGGTKYLEDFSPFTIFVRDLEKTVEGSAKGVAKVATFLRTKGQELSECGKGPLLDARQELAKLRPKALTAQTSLDALKKKILAAKADFNKTIEREKNAYMEIKEQKEAGAILEVVRSKVESIESEQKLLDELAAPLSKLEGAELAAFEAPVTVLDKCQKLLDSMKALAAEVRNEIKEKQQTEQVKQATAGPLADAKRDLGKLKVRAEITERKAKSSFAAVKKVCDSLAGIKLGEAATAHRGDLVKRGITVDKQFTDLLKKGEVDVKEEAFVKNLKKIGLSMKDQHAKLLFRHLVPKGDGLSKRRFLSFVQQYFVVAKMIALTDQFEISKTKTIRKAELDEIIEVLEGPKTDESLGLMRIKGRSMSDAVMGWITVKGNQGTPFLQEVEKPFYACNTEVVLEKDFSSGEVVRKLKAEEVLELLEGPRKEASEAAMRVRGKAAKDDKAGWFSLKDRRGVVSAALDDKLYLCSSSVAVTDTLEVQDCKVLRKLMVGEVFRATGEPVIEPGSGITRLQGSCVKDGMDGWVTLKGNAGTVFAAKSTKHYVVSREVPFHKVFKSEGAVVLRQLEVGEAVELLEGPKAEATEPAVRVRGRVLGDGAEGWITLRPDTVRSWSAVYRCLAATPLHKTQRLPAEDDKENVIRELAKDERIELLEGPMESAGVMRMKACAEKDGAVGWVTLRDAEGKAMLTC